MAVEIDDICKSNHIALQVTWIPRNQNEVADAMSKLIDKDDWSLDQGTFLLRDSIWGHFTIDRFVTRYNTKCERFNSKFWNANTEAVKSFSVSWTGVNNWLVPPPEYYGNWKRNMPMGH